MFRNLKVFAFVLLLAALVVSRAAALIGPQSGSVELPASASVLTSVTVMYTPISNASSWTAMACSGMTEGGCQYFKDQQADALWRDGQGVLGGGVRNIEVIEDIDRSLQVWKMTVTIVRGENEKVTHDAYALVKFDDTQGKWLVDRVLYGPYLGFSK